MLFGSEIAMNEVNLRSSDSALIKPTIPRRLRELDETEVDEEWSTPLAKISRLYYDHESWSYAKEIIEPPSAACRKVGDEARSIVARHIIDRIREAQYLDRIHAVAPRLRSAVELLSKPDADYVYPPFRFVLNQLREKYPDVYSSVVQNVDLRLPYDMKPTTMLVSMAKYVLEDTFGDIEMNWGKFTALLCLSGALAIDSIEAGYPEGLVHVVDTFGLIVEQVMGEWILSSTGGNGWVGFIKQNQYQPILPPIPRTIVILTIIAVILYFIYQFLYTVFTKCLEFYLSTNAEEAFWQKWGNAYSNALCTLVFRYPFTNVNLGEQLVCPNPSNFLEAMYVDYIYG